VWPLILVENAEAAIDIASEDGLTLRFIESTKRGWTKLSEEQLSNKTRTSRPEMRTMPEAFESEEGTSSVTGAIEGLLIIASVVWQVLLTSDVSGDSDTFTAEGVTFLHLFARCPCFGICGIKLLARGNAIAGPSYCYKKNFFDCSSRLVWLIS